jgi:hypothetical protein
VDWDAILKISKAAPSYLFPGDAIEVATLTKELKQGNVLLTSEIPYNKGRGRILSRCVEALIKRLEEKVIHHLTERTSFSYTSVLIHKKPSQSNTRISNYCS